MSTQSTFSRREVVSLLGVTTGSAVVTTVTAQTAGARSNEVIRCRNVDAFALHFWLRLADRTRVAAR